METFNSDRQTTLEEWALYDNGMAIIDDYSSPSRNKDIDDEQ